MVGDMKVDILAIGVHPDDVELSCAGTILKHLADGYSAAILDLTAGELGTRGSGPLRLKEAEIAKQILGVEHRVNIQIPDGFFDHSTANKLKIIEVIRQFRPEIVLANAVDDRHPDHGRAAKLTHDACFLAGLLKVKTQNPDGTPQERWRPKAVYHYIQDKVLPASIVVDIGHFLPKKMESIMAYSSQFYNPNSAEADSPISGQDFLEFVKARARIYGRQIGVEFGEGFTTARPPGVHDLLDLL